MGKGATKNPAVFKFCKFREQGKVSESKEPREAGRQEVPEAHGRRGSSGTPSGKLPEAAI